MDEELASVALEPEAGAAGSPNVIAVLERIVWRSPDGQRIIGIAKPNGRRQISVIGNMADPQLGQVYEFTGRWRKNDKYNQWELSFYSYRTVLPEDASGVYHYLVRIAKWVGPDTAERLIDRYGGETLKVLKEQPERVIADQIRGLTPERVAELAKSLKDNEKLEAAMVETGAIIGGLLGQSAVEKAIGKWGTNAPHIIKRNAFRLTELPGVGFIRADQVYLKTGGQVDRLKRHAHAILHVLEEQAGQAGHTRITPLLLQSELARLIGEPHPRALAALIRAKRVVRTPQYIAHADLADAERYVANKLQALSLQQLKPLQLNEEVRALTETLENDQLTAFLAAQNYPVLVLTGGPGTGKTYTVARIMALWRANGLNIALAAPTGKAAKQMELALSATVGLAAKTIHSLLEAEVDDLGNFGFSRNDKNPLACNALVIDETSMVDVRLARSLFKAIPNECRILLVGDHYQLPSVGPGAVLRDILAAEIPQIELRKIKRNAGRIVHACHAIKDGQIPEPAPRLNLATGDNWRHIESGSAEHTLDAVRILLRDKLPALGLDPVWQVQLISPTNEKGPLSCAALNRIAKEIVNPGQYVQKLPFGLGDKVVRLQNGKAEACGELPCSSCRGTGESPRVAGMKCLSCAGRGKLSQTGEVRIVNGDLGVVRDVDEKWIYVDFLYPDRAVKIPRKSHELRLAYCLTCHKLQGSECEVTVLPLSKQTLAIPMVTREWLFTAMSRAKKFALTIGDLEYLPLAIKRIGNIARTTALEELLRQCRGVA